MTTATAPRDSARRSAKDSAPHSGADLDDDAPAPLAANAGRHPFDDLDDDDDLPRPGDADFDPDLMDDDDYEGDEELPDKHLVDDGELIAHPTPGPAKRGPGRGAPPAPAGPWAWRIRRLVPGPNGGGVRSVFGKTAAPNKVAALTPEQIVERLAENKPGRYALERYDPANKRRIGDVVIFHDIDPATRSTKAASLQQQIEEERLHAELEAARAERVRAARAADGGRSELDELRAELAALRAERQAPTAEATPWWIPLALKLAVPLARNLFQSPAQQFQAMLPMLQAMTDARAKIDLVRVKGDEERATATHRLELERLAKADDIELPAEPSGNGLADTLSILAGAFAERLAAKSTSSNGSPMHPTPPAPAASSPLDVFVGAALAHQRAKTDPASAAQALLPRLAELDPDDADALLSGDHQRLAAVLQKLGDENKRRIQGLFTNPMAQAGRRWLQGFLTATGAVVAEAAEAAAAEADDGDDGDDG